MKLRFNRYTDSHVSNEYQEFRTAVGKEKAG